MPTEFPEGLVRVRGAEAGRQDKRNLNYFLGISGRTAGARGISMNLVRVPPGGRAEPHAHVGFETAIYLLEGRVDNRYGEGLRRSVITEAGDFLYIPPGVPHQPVNLSDTEPAVAVIARTLATEDEPVEPYTP